LQESYEDKGFAFPDGENPRFDGGTIEDVIPDHDAAEQSTPVWSADGASIAVALNVTAVPGSNVPRGIFIVDWKTHRSRMLPGSEGFHNAGLVA